MLIRIQALNYRVLRYIDQTLTPFQVLIGPNASGKSTFLDVIAFLADILTAPNLADGVRERTPDLRDLTWMRASDWLEFAVEASTPQSFSARYDKLRYEIRLGIDEKTRELALSTETLWFIDSKVAPGEARGKRQLSMPSLFFPAARSPIPEHIALGQHKRTPAGWRKILNKTGTGNDYFRAETTEWNNTFRLGPKRPALANLPEDEERFPASIWFKRHISEGVQRIMLNSEELRRPCPPQSPRTFLPDGSNLPWVIHELEEFHPERLQEWVEHIKTALPDVARIYTLERPEDRHRYLMVCYNSGLKAPSWIVSDGTLRMLALTILAYLPNLEGIYLIEEPENGIHPRAVETVFQSLSSIYSAQVFLATHSPVILSQVKPEQLLCFARTEAGETDIVRGDAHPKLQNWRGEVSLDVLFAGGVLG